MTNSRAAEVSQRAPESDFVERLEALADRHYHHRHPFNALMHAGRLDRGICGYGSRTDIIIRPAFRSKTR
jgi:hypothetical protein